MFGHQSQQLKAINAAAGIRTAHTCAALARDPRPGAVARSLESFTGTGMHADLGGAQVIVGDAWSCGPCHADGLTDRLAWQIGSGTSYRASPRRSRSSKAPWPLGWQGSTSDLSSAAPSTSRRTARTATVALCSRARRASSET